MTIKYITDAEDTDSKEIRQTYEDFIAWASQSHDLHNLAHPFNPHKMYKVCSIVNIIFGFSIITIILLSLTRARVSDTLHGAIYLAWIYVAFLTLSIREIMDSDYVKRHTDYMRFFVWLVNSFVYQLFYVGIGLSVWAAVLASKALYWIDLAC